VSPAKKRGSDQLDLKQGAGQVPLRKFFLSNARYFSEASMLGLDSVTNPIEVIDGMLVVPELAGA
jgi:hypothetical protein